MLLPRSAVVACGPRPGARGKKHDLFSTPAFPSGQWRTRRGGRAPGGQQRAARRGASAPRRVRPQPPEEGKPRLQPPHAVPAPRARSGPRPHPRAAPRPRPAPAACPRPSSGGERRARTGPLKEQACLASATAAARAQRDRPQRSAGPRRPPARPASEAAEPCPLSSRAARGSLSPALTCPLRLCAAAAPHSGRDPTVRLNQPPRRRRRWRRRRPDGRGGTAARDSPAAQALPGSAPPLGPAHRPPPPLLIGLHHTRLGAAPPCRLAAQLPGYCSAIGQQ